MLNQVAGQSSQNPGRLRLELTAASMNLLPGMLALPWSLAVAAGLSPGRKLRAAGSRVLNRDIGLVVLGLAPPVAVSGRVMMMMGIGFQKTRLCRCRDTAGPVGSVEPRSWSPMVAECFTG